MRLYFRLKKILLFLLLAYGSIPLFSVSITLLNDSAYILNAQIMDNTGRQLALIHLIPGQMYIYDAMQGTFQRNTNQPYTPYTIVFLCESNRPYDYSQDEQDQADQQNNTSNDPKQKKEKPSYISQFGIWQSVPRGALVNALGCPSGTLSCVMQKHPKLNSKKQSSQNTNQGMNNWSNDGGITWSNDSGPGWFDCPQDGSPCQKRNTPAFGSRNEATNWTNKTDLTVQNAYGEFWINSDGTDSTLDNSSVDQKGEKSNSEKTHSEIGFFPLNRNGSPESKQDPSESYTPTESTPLPFKQKNP
jgi:hypothetical protein